MSDSRLSLRLSSPARSAPALLSSPSFWVATAQFLCSRRTRAFPPEYKGSAGPGSLLSYRGVGPETAVLLLESEGSPEGRRPPAGGQSPRLGSPSSPHPQALRASWRPRTMRVEALGTEPRAHGRRLGRLPRNRFELREPMSQRVWAGLLFSCPDFENFSPASAAGIGVVPGGSNFGRGVRLGRTRRAGGGSRAVRPSPPPAPPDCPLPGSQDLPASETETTRTPMDPPRQREAPHPRQEPWRTEQILYPGPPSPGSRGTSWDEHSAGHLPG